MIDAEHLRQWIGREAIAKDVLTRRIADGLLALLDRAPGGPVPPLVHWCLAPDIVPMARIGADGHPERGDFLPPVPLPRRMWAAGALTFHDPLKIGDMIARRSRIADVAVKEGRSGTLCFVTVEHRIETARGLAIEERQDIVYRGETAAGAPAPPPAPLPADETRTIAADPVMLFRYSALTFNGHRIHYDRDYARDIEHYPGLVVHGPLQATLLLNLAIDRRNGWHPASLSFRATGAMHDGPLTLGAADDDDGVILFTADDTGRLGMSARAVWTAP